MFHRSSTLIKQAGRSYNFTTIKIDGGGVSQDIIGELIPYTRYAIIMQAFNSRGAGPTSPKVFAETMQDSQFRFKFY